MLASVYRSFAMHDPPGDQPRPHRQRLFDGVKLFAATKFADRQILGETVTNWIAANQQLTVADVVVTQSSDAEFHCVTICVFYRLP